MATPTIDIAGNSAVYSLGRGIAKLTEFAHDFAPDYSAVGGVVKMPILAAEAGVFNKSTNNYEQNSTINTASITVNKHFVAGFSVSPQQMSDGLGAYTNLFRQAGENAGRAIAHSVEEEVVGLVDNTTATPAQIALTKAGFAGLYATVMSKELDPGNCVLVLNPAAYSKLIEVLGMDVVNLQSAVETGRIDNFLGFRAVVCSGKVDDSILGFVAERGAIGIVGRRIPLLEGYPVYQEFVDEETGVPVTLVGFLNFATGDYFITATALFGAAITRAAGIVPLTLAQ